MLSSFSSKYTRFLGLVNTAKYLYLNKIYFSYNMILLHNRRIHSLTSKTTVQKFCFTNKSNNFTSVTVDNGKNVDYDDILEAQKDNKILIIDVREESEIKETGKLPGSIHIPMADVSIALTNLSNQEFEKKYNRKKPSHDTKIILSCKSGIRSALVQSDMQKLGYKNALNYTGGWLDWESKQKV